MYIIMTAGQTFFTIAHFAKRALLLNINFYLSLVFSLKTTSTLFFKFISNFKCIFKMLYFAEKLLSAPSSEEEIA